MTEKCDEDEKTTEEELILLKFLERTKDGAYAVIEMSSLPYARLKEERDYIGEIEHFEDDYVYSVT